MSAKTTLDVDTPPLRDGDRLTADEFHRRYEAMPRVKDANLVNGVVHMGSPIRIDSHSRPHGLVMAWLGNYSFRLPGVELNGNGTLRIDAENEVEPDAMMILGPATGGNSWVDEQDYRRGAPEFVVEIAASSTRLDTGEKWELYQRIGVREYFLWRVLEEQIDWWGLVDDSFERLPTDAAGVVRSRVFPGLWLHIQAMIDGDRRQVADTLAAGMASPEHMAFVAGLTTPGS